MALPPGQLAALRNLSSKKAGNEVDWINIADARALVELGLAERNREGWVITPAGAQAIAALDGAATPSDPGGPSPAD